jgi:alkanesulfonate monooxygenase SsuD/methylene tetrahydromethanopterin reductase-like flavin-dependent oxidoreductase (luciferase family)
MNGSRPPWAGIGVSVPSCDAYGIGHPVLEVARAAEQAGLDHVWVASVLHHHKFMLRRLTKIYVTKIVGSI